MTNSAEQLLLARKGSFASSLLTTNDGVRPVPRIVQLRYSTQLGFYIVASKDSSKIKQIQKNPFASIIPGTGQNTIVARVTLRITDDQKIIDAAWSDDLLKVGYTGKDDKRLCVIQVTVNSVRNGFNIIEGTAPDQSTIQKIDKSETIPATGPFRTKEIQDIIRQTFTSMKITNLITSDGLGHDSRVVGFRYMENVGLYICTHLSDKKVKQMRQNNKVAIFITGLQRGEQIVIDASANLSESPEIKHKIWEDIIRSFGFTGPNDKELVVGIFTPRRIIRHRSSNREPDVLVAENQDK